MHVGILGICQMVIEVLMWHMVVFISMAQLMCSLNLIDTLCLIAGEVQCEQPNNSLYTFTGNLIVDKQTLPLSPNHLLLRVWYLFLIIYFRFLYFTWWNCLEGNFEMAIPVCCKYTYASHKSSLLWMFAIGNIISSVMWFAWTIFLSVIIVQWFSVLLN